MTVFRVIVAAVELLLCGAVIWEKRKRKAGGSMVTLPNYFVPLGAVCAAVFLTFSWFANGTAAILLAALAQLGNALVLGWCRCTIAYDEKRFVYGRLFGVRRAYSYDQLKEYRGNVNREDLILYTGKSRIRIDSMAVGRERFWDFARKQYRTAHGGESLPQRPKRRHSFFDNMQRPSEFIFIYSLLILMICAMLIALVVWDGKKEGENTTIKFEAIATGCSMEGDDLTFSCEGYAEPFRISSFTPYAADPEGLLEALGNPLTIWARLITPTNGSAFYAVYQVADKSGAYFTFENANTAGHRTILMLYAIFGGFLILISFCFFMTIRIGRNPKRYPRWFVRLFIKDGYC